MINTYIHAMMIIVGVYTFYDHDLATPVSWRANLTERWLQPCLLFVSSAIFADLCYFTMTYFGNVSMLAGQPYSVGGCSHDWHLSERSRDDHPVLV